MKKTRKTINTIGLFSLLGAVLIILGIGLLNINRHRATSTDKKNIEQHKQTISENEKSAITILIAIAKMASYLDNAKNEISKYFPSNSRIPNTTVYRKQGYLFNVSLYSDFWFCYAWPEKYGITGLKSYYIGSEETPRITEKKFNGINDPAKNKDASYWKDFHMSLESLK